MRTALWLALHLCTSHGLISSDPRERATCRDVFGASKESQRATIRYAMRVREDMRISPPPDVRLSPRVTTAHHATVGNITLNFVSIRKVASRAGQAISSKLAKLNDGGAPPISVSIATDNATRAAAPPPSRAVFWAIVRDPWAKIESAYKETLYQMASSFLGCRADQPADWLCTRAWATMARKHEPARFAAFVDDVLFGPFAAVEDDRVSYHAFSQVRKE